MLKTYKISIPIIVDFEGNNMSPQDKNIILNVMATSSDEAVREIGIALERVYARRDIHD